MKKTPEEIKLSYQLRAQKRKDANTKVSWDVRLQKIREVHGDKYTYGDNSNKGYSDKIEIICSIHGVFHMHMFAHLHGRGCNQCRKENIYKKYSEEYKQEQQIKSSRIRVVKSNKSRLTPVESLKEQFNERFSDKFTYNWETYKGVKINMEITCPHHGLFLQSPEEHRKATFGCIKCSTTNTSVKETTWLKQFTCVRQERLNINGKLFKVDGVDYINKIVYEYLGDFWHGHPSYHKRFNGINAKNKKPFIELFEETQNRLNVLMAAGYKVIYAWEQDEIVREFKGNLEY